MEEKNFITIMELLAEKVRELQLEVRLLKYENESLSKENEEYKKHSKVEFKKIERFGEEKDG